MSHCYITLNEIAISHNMSNCYVTLEKFSLFNIVLVTSIINNIRIKYKKVFSIFRGTFSMDFKRLFNAKIKPFELYSVAVLQI